MYMNPRILMVQLVELSVESQRKDLNTIFLKLQIADSTDFCNEIIV
jgi:hypothetical protein